jgi:tetratricopeptide (TPR) repeat protein
LIRRARSSCAALRRRARGSIGSNCLGIALLWLGQRESGTVRLDQAIEAYRAALEEGTRELVPLDWAETQNVLGGALLRLGVREDNIAPLERAVGAYRAALQECTREHVPLNWAKALNNLGYALLWLSEQDEDTVRLEQTVETFQTAQELTIEASPAWHDFAQQNLTRSFALLQKRSEQTCFNASSAFAVTR